MEIVHLWPLSQGEMLGVKESFLDLAFAKDFSLKKVTAKRDYSRTDLIDILVRGGYPEALVRADPFRRSDFFNAYVTTLLSRDVRDLAGIADVSQISRLLRALVSRVGSILNTADLSRTLEIPATTLKRYFGLLEAIFLVQQVPPWSTNLDIRVTKSPRVYFTDTGLLAHQARWSAEALADNTWTLGPLLENFVVLELRKQMGWNRSAVSMSYYRTPDGNEVDIVLEGNDGRVVGVEVKATKTLDSKDFRGLQHFAERLGKKLVRGVLLYTGTEKLAFGPNLYALPIGALWG
jgi:hypothetical protein